MSRLVTSMFWIIVVLRGEPTGGDLLLNEELGGERFEGLLTWLEGDDGEIGEVFASPMASEALATFTSTPVSEYRVLTDREVRCASRMKGRFGKMELRPRMVFFQQPGTGVCFIRSCHALTVMTCIQKGISHVRA
jgi:hypothetical protein